MTEFPRVYATARGEISLGLLLLLPTVKQRFLIPRGLFEIDTKTLSMSTVKQTFLIPRGLFGIDTKTLSVPTVKQTFLISRDLFGIDTKTLSSCQIRSHFSSNAQSNVESRSDKPGQFHKKTRRSGPKLLVWRICPVRRGEPRTRDELWSRRPRAEAGGRRQSGRLKLLIWPIQSCKPVYIP